MKLRSTPSHRGPAHGSSLVELVIALAIAVVTIGGSVKGYLLTANKAEWSAYSLAAHSMALQRLEQTRAAKWDPGAWPPVDRLLQANFPPVTNVLDVPISGTNVVYGRVYTTVTNLAVQPPLKLVRVECVWSFHLRGSFTNTVLTYRAPDQ